VAKGVAIVTSIISGIKNAIKKGSDILTDLLNTTKEIGEQVINGIIKGLKGKAKDITDYVEHLAGKMVKKFTDKFSIGSPSRVFMELGGYIMDGLAIGLDDGAANVYGSIDSVADGMISTMAKANSDISSALDGVMDADPTIRPILDLTAVEDEAKKMPSILDVGAINAAASYDQAAFISSSQMGQGGSDEGSIVEKGVVVNFQQNNTSPESLSASEIYRQTQNQLALAKNSLNLATV